MWHTTTMHDIYIVSYTDDNHDFSIVTASEESAVREAIGILIDFDHLDAETESFKLSCEIREMPS